MTARGRTIFSLARETLQWTVLFALCTAPVERPCTAFLTVLFALFLCATIPLSLLDLRAVFMSEILSKSPTTWRQRPVKLVETLALLLAIMFGAIFTQLDWDQWFLAWPFPSALAYVAVGAFVAVKRRQRTAGKKKKV